MNRTLRVIALLLFLGVGAAADAMAQGPTIGFKLGVSSSTFSIDPDPPVNFESLMKFTGGGFIRFGFGAVDLQPELMYVTKGAEAEEDGATLQLKLDYIEIPVLLHVPLMRGGNIMPYIYGGPAFAFEVSCKVNFEADGVDLSGDCDEEDDEVVSTDRRSWDIGALVGGGIAVPAGPGSLLLEARYNFGLMNLNESEDDDTKVKNRSGALLVGYAIPIGRR